MTALPTAPGPLTGLNPSLVEPGAAGAVGLPHISERGIGSVGRHLVALDIDGTTVHHDGTMSPAVAVAVRAAAQEHDVVFATGRAVIGALPVIREAGLDRGYAVCSNGAVTVRLDPREPDGYVVIDSVTFDPAPALARLHGAWPDAQVAVEEIGRGFRVSAPFADGELEGEITVVSWAELAAHPVSRMTFRSPTGTSADFLALAERIGMHGVNYSVGFTAWLDIAPDGVSKASALERVRRELGTNPAATLAVGDQRNDIEMLGWAACGVAMGNAPAEVAMSADAVTDHVDADGLVAVLAQLPQVPQVSQLPRVPR